jgi:predicted dithiol-disulfide oxidoreductase (DUF899 family)
MQSRIASREEWLAARLKVLEQEKDLTRRSDALAHQPDGRKGTGCVWWRRHDEYDNG